MLRLIKASATEELNISNCSQFLAGNAYKRTKSSDEMVTVIKNEATRVARLRAEVFKVEVQSLDDASGNENRRTPCTSGERTDSTK